MEWLLKVTILWLSVDLVIISTLWYLSATISQLWPDWWRNVIVDTIEPDLTDEVYAYIHEVEAAELRPLELRSDNRVYPLEL